jgi:alpha-mannosidase
MLTVHVVSHTHWDREWYHPAERFRQRLVTLIDEVLDLPPTDGSAFLLDGQTVVLEDYLAVRPERASELAAAFRARQLEAGPWFVLADELIPSGEGLVRNLLAGRQTLRSLRADSPSVLYCPDSFGHPAALPMLAHGFGKSLVVLWRGFGGTGSPNGDAATWVAPSGQEVILYHLTRSGYELGANLPTDPDAARERWKAIRSQFDERSTTGAVLLMNGADHHARQEDLGAAVRALESVAKRETIKPSSLETFATDVRERAGLKKLPTVRGELRNSYGFTWTLQGTLASRSPQKRRYVQTERELLRDVEPWAALAAFYGKPSRRQLTRAAWHPLLLCQPHDTLCGCSIDSVARAMDTRLDSAAVQAAGLREDAVFDLIGHDRDNARKRSASWQSVIVVRNRAARPRSGVAVIPFTRKLADVPVGPGSAQVKQSTERRRLDEPSWPVQPTQLLDIDESYERVEAPRAYPDNDVVARLWTAVWVNEVPAYGVSSIPADAADSSLWADEEVRISGRRMWNEHLSLRWNSRGGIVLEARAQRRSIRALIDWESRADQGDLYTPSPRQKKFTPKLSATRVIHRGPLIAAVEQLWTFRQRDEQVEARVRFALDAGADFLRIGVLGDNSAVDHRLRLRIRTDVNRAATFADAAFGVVEREVPELSARATKNERVVPTAPLHRYVSLFNASRGVTLFSDGLTEYETTSSDVFVTLIRSVGELSRSDIPERPGHAGWPSPTPEAQCVGPFAAEFGLMLHGPRTPETIDRIERAADDVLYPLAGETLRSALRVAPAVHGVELHGPGLAFSSAKESEDGDWVVLRCVNLLDHDVNGSWRLGRQLREARMARLDETPTAPLSVRIDTVPFVAPKRGVVTILVR